jgi:hypothetical protein
MNYSKGLFSFFTLVWVVLFIYIITQVKDLSQPVYISFIVLTVINYLFVNYIVYKTSFDSGSSKSTKDEE